MKRTFTHYFMGLSCILRDKISHMKALLKAFTYRWYRNHQYLKVFPLMLVLLIAAPHFASASVKAAFFQQQEMVTIHGTVVDDKDNSALPSVSIATAAHKTLGVTNINGEFTIRVAKGTEVQYSFVGYATVKVTYSANKDKETIRLKATSNDLNEVVVTALGIKREEKALGYAATVVSGDQLTDAPSDNWTDALSGKVAGLNMVRSNSGPGGSNKIILRGENNLTGTNEALIIIDGVMISESSGSRHSNNGENVYGTGSDNMPTDYGSNINDINPQDIESVTVLKGAAASALYGERGANGAVIITTKSGSSKKKGFGVSFTSDAKMEKINRWPDMQFEYGQGLGGADYYSFGASADGASTSGTSSAYGPKFDGQMFYQFDPVTQTQGKTRTPWVPYTNKIHDFFNTGHTIANSVSVDGGTDRTTARFSVTNRKNDWIIPNTGYTVNSVNLSVNSKVNDKLTINSKVTYNNNSSDNLPGAGYGNLSLMYWFIFWQPNADIDWLKNYWVNGQTGRNIEYPYSTYPSNPYAVSYEYLNKRKRNTVTGNISATYQITKELSLQLRTSMDMGNEQDEQDRPYDAGTRFVKGSFRTQDIFNQETSGDFLLRYNKKINKDFTLGATAGGSMLRNHYTRNEIRADSLVYPGLYSPANAAGPLVAIPDKANYNINSWYGIVDLSYKDFLYMELTDREDYNSTLATATRTTNSGFNFPGASISFIPTEVFKMPKSFDYLKVRLSGAQVGSGARTPYLTAYNYSPIATYPGGLTNPSTLANPNLKPLRTSTYELGFEGKMFHNRFGFDITGYAGNTKNQQLLRILDEAAGNARFITNIGQVNNSGVEVALNGTIIQSHNSKGFTWTAFGTFSANKNKIVQLADSSFVLRTGPVGGGQIVATVGGSIGDLYGRGFVRSPDGQIVYDASTGFAKLTDGVVYLGNTNPKYKVSWGSNFKLGQFSLQVLFDAQHGAVAHSLTNYKMVEQGKLESTVPGRYSGIIGDGVIQNPDGTYRKNDVLTFDVDNYYRSQMGQDNAEGSTFSTDFIKFREANITYTFPQKLTKRLGLQFVSLGVYGRDLFIWSPWPIFDPEFGTLSGTDIVNGFEIGQFPSTREMGATLRVRF